jgi:16S rRNA (guanine966-N2)-methyltransferase
MLEGHRPGIRAAATLDLYAGSGALGIEALSRGAPRAVFVERDARAAAVISRNLARTGLEARARLVRRDVSAFLAADPTDQPEAPFGLVFVDPPYERSAGLDQALERLASGPGWLADGAVVVAKHFWKTAPPDALAGLRVVRVRRFGETALSVYRRLADPTAGGE